MRQLLVCGIAALLLGGAAPVSCNALTGGKLGGAVDPVPGSIGLIDVSGYKNCDNYPAFHDLVQPIVTAQCISCHGPGGKGAEKLLFQQVIGTTDDADIAQNYAAALQKFNPDFGGGDVEANLILAKVNGRISHDLKLDTTGNDYVNLVTWAAMESANNGADFCNPAAGTGTLNGGAGASGGGSAGH